MIKTICSKHKCGRLFNNKNATARWVGKVVAKKLQNHQKIKINEIVADIQQDYSTGITSYRAWKARQIAKNIVDGEAEKQYTLRWAYSAELRKVNVGNTCKINMYRPSLVVQPRFERFYMCLDGCKRGFRACRPFIGVDGCHLKTQYGGILLIAVGRDPNDQYFPLAFGVVEMETKDSWKWFLDLLLRDIGEYRWVFISDQQKV